MTRPRHARNLDRGERCARLAVWGAAFFALAVLAANVYGWVVVR